METAINPSQKAYVVFYLQASSENAPQYLLFSAEGENQPLSVPSVTILEDEDNNCNTFAAARALLTQVHPGLGPA
jgi:hypothetical protein